MMNYGGISIGNNVMIGSKVTILPDVSIGDNVVIGAGAIVTKDIPSNCVATGVPCKPIEDFEYFVKKRKMLKCIRDENIIWEEFDIKHTEKSSFLKKE